MVVSVGRTGDVAVGLAVTVAVAAGVALVVGMIVGVPVTVNDRVTAGNGEEVLVGVASTLPAIR